MGGCAAGDGEPAIRTQGLTKTFEGGRVRALSDVDLEIARGEFVAVVGPSGSGKSTLLHLLGALDRPDSGSISVSGLDLASGIDRDGYRSGYVGMVFQLDHLLPVLTARENVEAALVGAGVGRGDRRRRVREVLAEVDLSEIAGRRPPALSGGERQRLAIARALVNRPSVLLADEPTGRLDQGNGARVMKLISDLRLARGLTILLVTHDPSIASWADRVLELVDGRLDGAG